MDSIQRFEALAQAFYLCTGIMAPGKDRRMDDGVDDATRLQKWEHWNKENGLINRCWIKTIDIIQESNQ